MLLGGDEFGRTQGGNNNGWCQDSEISWFDWSLIETNADLLEFTRKLIALRRAHAVFRRRQFLFGHEIEGSGLPDAAWFRADGARMTRRGLERRSRRSSACSSTARRSPRRTRAAARCSTSRSCCCSTATTRTARSRCPRGVRRGVDGRARHGATDAEAREGSPPATSSSWSTTRWCCCAASSDDRVARDVPAPARRRLRLRRSARARAVPARPRDLAPVPAAVVPGPRGVHARLRRGRPRLDLERARRRGGVLRARSPPRARPGLGIVLDIVPNHMATDDANRFWADPALRGEVLRRRRRDRPPPAVLRRRPPGRACARRTRRCSRRRTRWRCGSCARASSTACGSTIRTGSRTPPATCAAARRRRRARVGREDPRPRRERCATGRSRARSATSSSTTSARCTSTRPARRR